MPAAISSASAAPSVRRCGRGSESGSLTPDETRNAGPPPRGNPNLLGHEASERALRRLFESGRMPHAVLMTGPRGIGKATLAYRFARFVLLYGATGIEANAIEANAIEARLPTEDDRTLAVPADCGVFRRVASGGHADLLEVERA